MIAINAAHTAARSLAALIASHARMNAGVTGSVVRVYGGVRPGVADEPATPVLVSIVLPKPAGVIDGFVLNLTPPADDALILVSGVATWARVVNGAGVHVFDCDVSDAAGVATLRLSDTQLYEGGITRLISGFLV